MLPSESTHARDLLPTIEGLLEKLGGTRDSIEEVFCGIGPGSYTGLRVGIATALGLAYASGANLRAVPSFEALAYEALTAGQVGCIAWNARARSFYFAKYRRLENDVECLREPEAVTKENLHESLRGESLVLVDHTVVEAADLDETIQARTRIDEYPTAQGILALGPRRDVRSLESVEPLYLRQFGE